MCGLLRKSLASASTSTSHHLPTISAEHYHLCDPYCKVSLLPLYHLTACHYCSNQQPSFAKHIHVIPVRPIQEMYCHPSYSQHAMQIITYIAWTSSPGLWILFSGTDQWKWQWRRTKPWSDSVPVLSLTSKFVFLRWELSVTHGINTVISKYIIAHLHSVSSLQCWRVSSSG